MHVLSCNRLIFLRASIEKLHTHCGPCIRLAHTLVYSGFVPNFIVLLLVHQFCFHYYICKRLQMLKHRVICPHSWMFLYFDCSRSADQVRLVALTHSIYLIPNLPVLTTNPATTTTNLRALSIHPNCCRQRNIYLTWRLWENWSRFMTSLKTMPRRWRWLCHREHTGSRTSTVWFQCSFSRKVHSQRLYS